VRSVAYGGFSPPARIPHASAEYRESHDIVGAFIADRCVLGAQQQVMSNLHPPYVTWCRAAGEKPLARNVLGMEPHNRGLRGQRLGERDTPAGSGLGWLTEDTSSAEMRAWYRGVAVWTFLRFAPAANRLGLRDFLTAAVFLVARGGDGVC
jgi:phage/plasmid-associated DNA primase